MLIALFPSSLTGNDAAVNGGVLKSLTKGPSNVIIEISLPIFKFKWLQTLIALKAENYLDAKIMVESAQRANKINMVNFTYRESSAYQKLVDIIKSGDLGVPRHVCASYYQSWLTSNK